MTHPAAPLPALLLVALLAAPAAAQEVIGDVHELVIGPDVREFMQTSRPQPPAPALDSVAARRLEQARSFARAGAYGAARGVLEDLARRYPHHPQVLIERVDLYYADHDWPALERLCRAERLARRDSLFMAHPLVQALTYQNRHREAAQVAIEAVVASPPAATWVGVELHNQALADPAGVRLARDRLRVAWNRAPHRDDLLMLLARLEWDAGEHDHALALLETPLKQRPASSRLLWDFGHELLRQAAPGDSLGAAQAFLILARHAEVLEAQRVAAARRAFGLRSTTGAPDDLTLEVYRALRDVPPGRWGDELAVGLARALRQGGRPADARALLERLTGDPDHATPGLLLERALGELRDGPPAAVLPVLRGLAASPDAGYDARFYLAEAFFYSGRADSAAARYEALARENPGGRHAEEALDRVYLIEDAAPREALLPFARASYERWRGDLHAAQVAADSLLGVLPRNALWARTAVMAAELREELGHYPEALAVLAAVADSLPADRLAPLARKKMGDLYRLRLRDPARALAAYEECLARYPKAWLAPEVRRVADELRKARTF